MKKQPGLLILLLVIVSNINSQEHTLNLSFTGIDSTSYKQLDSVVVVNRTRHGDTVLHWPDTILTINYVGIQENPNETMLFQIFQNYPNPVWEWSTINLLVPERDQVILTITDISGRKYISRIRSLDKGIHSFRFTPGKANEYIFSARWRGYNKSIKILCTASSTHRTASLQYKGRLSSLPKMKFSKKRDGFDFYQGDELLYIAWANGVQSGIIDKPENNTTYVFQFATNIPCPDMPMVEYEGQIYHTIQIYSQCWLKENLNVGEMIPGDQQMKDNGVIEKYCYNNEQDSCMKYGGLYQWEEFMQYDSLQGTQGICPPGWHLPTDEEWKVLEGASDSQYGIGDHVWDTLGYRGYDAGENLKASFGWNDGGNGTDLFGFSALPGGLRDYYGNFSEHGIYAVWWSSTAQGFWNAWIHRLKDETPKVRRDIDHGKTLGFSARCLRNQ